MPERLAEVMGRSIFTVVVYIVVLSAVVVLAGATGDWFVALGLIVPWLWLLEWILSTSLRAVVSCSLFLPYTHSLKAKEAQFP